MGIELSTILGVMGTVWTGDVVSLDPSFSIGGKSPAVNNILGNLGGLLGMRTLAQDSKFVMISNFNSQVNPAAWSPPTTLSKRTLPTPETIST